MALIARTKASLRFFGDGLIPDEVTQILGCEPAFTQLKGESIVGRNTGKIRIANTGCWRLEAVEAEPGNLDAQIEEILSRITSDLAVWKELTSKFEVDLFCGLFMNSDMEGICISSTNLLALGERGIEIGLDVYGPD